MVDVFMYFQWYITIVFLDIPFAVSVYGQLHMHAFVKDRKEEGEIAAGLIAWGFTVLRNLLYLKVNEA